MFNKEKEHQFLTWENTLKGNLKNKDNELKIK
jgi:hypothetical protein